MGRRFLQTLLFVAVAAMSMGVVFGQKAVGGEGSTVGTGYQCVQRITTSDWNILLGDLRSTNAEIIHRIETDAKFRGKQVDNLRELFAFGCQAVKNGVLTDPVYLDELGNIRREITAVQFERSTVGPALSVPLASVTEARIAAFYKIAGNEDRFKTFLNTKMELLRRGDPDMADRQVSDDETTQAKTIFAKLSLLAADRAAGSARLTEDQRAKTEFQIRLQQTQFLARILGESLGKKTAATDPEIDKYLAEHAELDVSVKRAKAESILKRALAGEDFATLANTYSDDPGNIEVSDGKKQGGLYRDVPLGKMLPEFEKTALGLVPGTVSPVLTPSDFGYHIIKLERRYSKAGGTYDVRHILISTGFKDPDDPNGREMPARDFARRQIEKKRLAELTAKVVKENPIEIADLPAGTAIPKKPATPPVRN